VIATAVGYMPLVRVGSYFRLADEILRCELRGARAHVRIVNRPIPRQWRAVPRRRRVFDGRHYRTEVV
jgi:hypothetical protein